MKKFNELVTEQFKYSEGFLNAFKEVGIGIYEITEYGFLKSQKLLLDDEKKLKEFRVKLSKYYTEERFKDDWGSYDEDEYKEDISISKDKERIGKVEEPDRYNDAEFSVFLPDINFRDKDDEKYDLFVAACLTAAAAYFKTLQPLPETYNSPIVERTYALWEPEGLGMFLNYHMTLVDNQNLSKAKDGIYRIYKDSKFFYELQELIDKKSDYEWLMKELSKIVG